MAADSIGRPITALGIVSLLSGLIRLHRTDSLQLFVKLYALKSCKEL